MISNIWVRTGQRRRAYLPGRVAAGLLFAVTAFVSLGLILPARTVRAADGEESWKEEIPGRWGGHVKIRGKISFPEKGSLLAPSSADSLKDGSGEFRLKCELELRRDLLFALHYENIYSGGNTRRATGGIQRLPGLREVRNLFRGAISDERRLLDLTTDLDEDPGHIWYHRLDRLFLSYTPSWGNIRMGRQAVTWGSGRIFNPMDLFNPFSPSDVERDYKIGDDILSVEVYPGGGDLQVLYVPRRDPETQKVSWNHSSLAGKMHFMTGGFELDVMSGRHYEDIVTGLGISGYLGNAAWRVDGVATFMENDRYLSFVANLDYSWVWGGKNVYGLLEFYHNGLLENDYAKEVFSPPVSERLARGEIYTLGNRYLAGTLQIEAHPLVNLFLTAITNLADPSGLLQPRVVYDLEQNTRITAGADLYWGEPGSEFGGWEVPRTGLSTEPADGVYVWLSRFF